jgi:antitoxin ParD1/3/4
LVPTRNVVLTDSQEELIRTLVNSGRYQNASEVIREGLRLIERRQMEEAAKLDALRAAADTGIADIQRGAYREFVEPGSLETYLTRLTDDLTNVPKQPR